jgi:DNA-directed RNA polymerase subunit M/transcription elongation factor TFIIS
MKFCPVCNYMLYIKSDPQTLSYECRNCGHAEKDEKGGLILEMNVGQKSTESYKIILNEFTKYDPTLPHIKVLKCPNEACPTNKGAKERDIIYQRHDRENMKYTYICNVCDFTWRSRS